MRPGATILPVTHPTPPLERHHLIHRQTGQLLYTTTATPEEITEANRRLAEADCPMRFVPARLTGH